MTPEATSASPSPKWLTPDELQTWKALHLLVVTLPGALGSQLQCESNLSLLEYYVLAVLSEQPGQTMRMSQLAVLASSELSRLSHLVRRLEKRGLVRRRPEPEDGRWTHAILTPAGKAEVIKAAPGHVKHVRHLIFDVLDDSEQHALRASALKILSGMGVECSVSS